MKRVRVLIPFHSRATNKDLEVDDIIEVTDEQLANIRAVNVNMVLVLGDVVKKKATTKPKATK
jgi:hypothetical protein